MLKILLSICLFSIFNTLSFASLNDTSQKGVGYDGKLSTFQNGTLSITVDAAPAGGLPAPKILVLRGFVVAYYNTVNWGDTWNLIVPSANYRIHPLPVSDGTNFYVASSDFVSVPPGGMASRLITYHLL